MRRRTWCALVALPLAALAACATVMNTLEKATDENSVEGKARPRHEPAAQVVPGPRSERGALHRSLRRRRDPRAAALSAGDDESQLAYVERVGHGIVATNDDVLLPFLDYRFGILATDEVNAFACPGGLILVTAGYSPRHGPRTSSRPSWHTRSRT
jgi:predicted Zn-dependent protease